MNLAPFINSYVQVKRSPKHGVGLFAAQAIPKGFQLCIIDHTIKWRTMTDREFVSLPVGVQDMVSMYCIHRDGAWSVPSCGFDRLDPIYFVNHSCHPNITTYNDGDSFVTLEDIKTGTELTLDYRIYKEDRPYLPGRKCKSTKSK